MSRLGRGAAWLACWPVGAALSIRHGRRRRHREVMDAIRDAKEHPDTPEAAHAAAAVIAVSDRLLAAGVTDKRTRLHLTHAAMQDVHAGVAVDVAVRRVLGGNPTGKD